MRHTVRHTPRSCRPTIGVAVLAATFALLASGCGLSDDARPELLSPDHVPYDLLDPELPPTTTAPPSEASTTVDVYFVSQGDDGTRLIPTEREVGDPGSVADRLRALLEQPPTSDEVDDGITTAIPSETVLVQVEQDPGSTTAIVELSPEFFRGAQGQSQQAAFAQITCTAVDVPGVNRVRFLLQGERVPALVADGTQKDGAVSCLADYLGYRIDPGGDDQDEPDPRATEPDDTEPGEPPPAAPPEA